MKINKFTSIVASLMLAGAFTSVSACEAPADVHPLSCPNPINANAKGLTPAALLGGAEFDRSYGAPYYVDEGEDIYMRDINLDEPIYLYIQTEGEPGDKAPAHAAVAVKYVLEDVAAPATGNPLYVPGNCSEGGDKNNCWDEEDGNAPDDKEDLAVKFKTQDVIKAIEISIGHAVEDGQTYCVTIQAKHKSGLNIHGTDIIIINKKNKKNKK